MKSRAKILLLLFGLMVPYMGFVLYRAFAYPQHPFPDWFLYVGPCYFFGSILLATLFSNTRRAGQRHFLCLAARVLSEHIFLRLTLCG
jgi:hypothetical protein